MKALEINVDITRSEDGKKEFVNLSTTVDGIKVRLQPVNFQGQTDYTGLQVIKNYLGK